VTIYAYYNNKKILLILILSTLLIPTVIAQPLTKMLVWEVEPKYDEVKYVDGWFYYDASFDAQTPEFFIFDYQTREVTPGFPDFLWGGAADTAWLYDENKGLYGWYHKNYDIEFSGMLSPEDFLEAQGEKLRAFRKINSDKIKNNSAYLSGYGIVHDDFLDEAYISDKYALAYGTKFVSDFIYDYSIKMIWLYRNDRDNAIALQYNNKWGVIGKDGNALTPFIFDDLIFIDDDTAFAKYNGKYGILDVEKTGLATTAIAYSPATGDNNSFYAMVLLIFTILLIKKLLFRCSK